MPGAARPFGGKREAAAQAGFLVIHLARDGQEVAGPQARDRVVHDGVIGAAAAAGHDHAQRRLAAARQVAVARSGETFVQQMAQRGGLQAVGQRA